MAAGLGSTIGPVVVLLSAGVLAVPLFRRLGLGSVLGYFAAGALVGPSAFGLFSDPAAMLHVSELGVVMFLFLIGLELRPQKLWAMRGQIFGLGLAQVVACTGLLTSVAILLFGLLPIPAFIAGAGFVLSSTAVIMSMLQERGELAGPDGQKAVSILLFEDLSIVPLLALVAWLSPVSHSDNGWIGIGLGVAAVAALLIAGRFLIDPFFGLLARARTREVLTAGALLVVLGAALLMERVGLSMAMGTFLAGVMLSGSSYRHQVEADVEPFKGLLMGLFFLAVGMSLDVRVVAERWPLLVGLLLAFVVVKAIGIYTVARLFRSNHRSAFRRALMFAQGGEFAFVLYTAAASGGVIPSDDAALFSTVIILSMALTPLVLVVAGHFRRGEVKSLDGVEEARDLRGRVLLVGFGRFGQIAAQLLLSRGVDVSMIENDPDRIREAGRFGFRVFYGDGTRLDALEHSGAAEAEVIMVCVDDRKDANRIVELVKANFPLARLLVRAYDRVHSIELIRAGVDVEVRETFDAALRMGAEGLRALGCSEERTTEALATIRRLDAERLLAQVQGGVMAGRENLTTRPVPEPLTLPRKLAADES
ncbi:monovalent cation:proton antiporter-2 (CPA2) family protein [Pleomorphomonas sp. NRK KF1]|uniref:monovalent cation:proton antiporter-2 (CPA2) family protein n=1 Tax=Pleomorphomonas sp. NRK KF1 TaxID=2943000 RepID=UPI002043DD4F|nr:monovalent cation:proton antiporter-2 (CPA2) family protein [Pleomorphomonas sp. NRK KF1]MCM5552729.1 monovalent cation:proton antiporter-2 (CPA2) family protein [Pleomorphomonas sp. NRK KF1]